MRRGFLASTAIAMAANTLLGVDADYLDFFAKKIRAAR